MRSLKTRRQREYNGNAKRAYRVSVEHDPLCICLCAVKHADSRQMAGLIARARSEPLTEAPLIVGRLLFPQAVQLLPRRGGVPR